MMLALMQDPGNLGGGLWAALQPIILILVTGWITYVVAKANELKGKLSGYAIQAFTVVVPVLLGFAQAKTGWDLSSAATAASGLVGWLGGFVGIKVTAK